MKSKYIIMHEKDNCATSLIDLSQNEEIKINNKTIKLINPIPVGHKFALKVINKGENVIKYGEIIGVTTKDINLGEWIHIHNIKSYYLEVYKDE